jgi:hypothetical protein
MPVVVLLKRRMSNITNEIFWDDEAFQARVNRLAELQGRSISEVCVRAGLAGDYLGKPARKGRNIRSIMALARSLRVSASLVLFDDDETAGIDSLPFRRLLLATQVAAYVGISLGTERRSTKKEIERVGQLFMALSDFPPAPARHR